MRLFAHEHHHNDSPWNDAPAWAFELREMLSIIIVTQETFMDALNAALAQLTTAIGGLDTAIQAEIAALNAALAGNNTTAHTATTDVN